MTAELRDINDLFLSINPDADMSNELYSMIRPLYPPKYIILNIHVDYYDIVSCEKCIDTEYFKKKCNHDEVFCSKCLDAEQFAECNCCAIIYCQHFQQKLLNV